MHEERDYEEWGVSGSVRFDPGERGRGLSMRLGSGWGAASGDAERLWTQRAVAPGSSTPTRAWTPRWATGSMPWADS